MGNGNKPTIIKKTEDRSWQQQTDSENFGPIRTTKPPNMLAGIAVAIGIRLADA